MVLKQKNACQLLCDTVLELFSLKNTSIAWCSTTLFDERVEQLEQVGPALRLSRWSEPHTFLTLSTNLKLKNLEVEEVKGYFSTSMSRSLA